MQTYINLLFVKPNNFGVPLIKLEITDGDRKKELKWKKIFFITLLLTILFITFVLTNNINFPEPISTLQYDYPAGPFGVGN